jgi:3-methylcrotonyl-CoA carboxylase alpha subunit
VLIERYVLQPRHIEIQVFADRHGGCVYLFERDCSVQRRHQKVIEEAPAPGMTPERRQQMGEAAVAAARAVGYEGAGTVEFIAAPDGQFYFMEMNTRLQVEHPVTEMITGLDLVEWQLRVANGEPLPRRQDELSIRGHAFEARVYAEDPQREFLPSIGRLSYLVPPAASANVRIDTGVTQGDVITQYYDPMISKLIVWDESRERALRRLVAALQRYYIVGVANNVEFLQRVATVESFATGNVDTGLIEREREFLFPPSQEPPVSIWQSAAAAIVLREADRLRKQAVDAVDRYSPWREVTGWRLDAVASRDLTLQSGETKKTVRITFEDQHRAFDVASQRSQLRSWHRTGDAYRFDFDGMTVDVTVVEQGGTCHVFESGRHHVFTLIDPLQFIGKAATGGGGLRSPMPGKIVAVLVKPGQAVEKGAPLIVVEAMKMEHTISAPAAGTVKAVRFAPGEQVNEGADLVEFVVAGATAA